MDYNHFFQAITNTRGESLVGYYARVIDPTTQAVVPIYSDNNGTPIVTVSGIANMAKTDSAGNLSFFVDPGTYHLDIYQPDASTFLKRIPSLPMTAQKGEPGDKGDTGDPGPADNTYTPETGGLTAFKASDVSRGKASLLRLPGIADGDVYWKPGDTTPDDGQNYFVSTFPGANGRWVRQGAEGVAFSAASGGPLRDLLSKARETVSVEDFGAVGDGIADDLTAFRAAISYLNSRGGGELLLTRRAYLISRPIDMETNVVIRGLMQGTTLTYKGTFGSDVTGVRCVISAGTKRFWGLHNVTLIGDRVKSGSTVTGANYGLYAEYSGYFEVSNVRADYCLEGFKFNQCQTFGLTQAVALRCSGYGIRLYNSCTSFRLKGCSPWACGGGFSLVSCIYGSIDTPFVENSDNGKLPGGADTDVFGDSGGDCYNPVFMYEIIGSQGITITSPGGENNCSQWLYAEGSQVVIDAPHLFNTKTFSAGWRLIQLRGTARCNVTITNPFGFADITQRVASSGVPVIFVENPDVQKLTITGWWRPASYGAAPAISLDGISDPSAIRLVDLTQAKMQVGTTTPFVKPDPADVVEISYQSGRKVIRLVAPSGGGKRYSIPLGVTGGWFRLKAPGTATGLQDVPRLAFGQYNASGGFIGDAYTTTSTGGTFTIGGWIYVTADAGNTLHLDLPANAGEEFQFSTIELDHIKGQG